MYLVLTWVVGKVLLVGNLYVSLSTTKSQLSSSACSVFLVMFSLAMWASSGQGAKVLSGQAFSSGTRQLPLLVALQVPEDTYYDLKHPRSVKENTSQWESELLSASHAAKL